MADGRSVPGRRAAGRDAGVTRLVHAARLARRQAYAPYSGFRVGAALETTSGVIISGCNVENASYSMTICAERVALFTAVAAGYRSFRRIAVVADSPLPTPPCGACRQVLWEFAADLEVLLAAVRGAAQSVPLALLLPSAFGGEALRTARSGDTLGTRPRTRGAKHPRPRR